MKSDIERPLFKRYWSAEITSVFGASVSETALVFICIEQMHASAAEAGMLAAARYIPPIAVGLFAGAAMSGRSVLRVMRTSNLVQLLLTVTLAILVLRNDIAVWQLIAAVCVISICTVFYDVSTGSYLPQIVSPEKLAGKNGIISGSHAIASLAGPSLAGVIMQLAGAFCALFIDATSYLVAFWIQRSLPDRMIDGGSDHIFKQLSNGFRAVFSERVLVRTTVAAAGINLTCGGLMVLGPWLTIRTFGLSLAVSGVVLSAQALGAVVGSFASHRISAINGIGHGITAACLIACLGYSLIAVASVNGPTAVHMFTIGGFIFQAGVAIFSVLARTYRQKTCNHKVLPLVLSTVRFISWGAIPVGSLSTGYLASSNAAAASVVIGGGVLLAALCVVRLHVLASPVATAK